eukprot:scaffold82610_cov37-Prasinocladus_malaysianus.AAC.1
MMCPISLMGMLGDLRQLDSLRELGFFTPYRERGCSNDELRFFQESTFEDDVWDTLETVPQVTKLSLRQVGVSERELFSPIAAALPGLSHIQITGNHYMDCGLVDLQNELGSLTGLTKLEVLQGCWFTTMHEGLRKLTSLKSLYLETDDYFDSSFFEYMLAPGLEELSIRFARYNHLRGCFVRFEIEDIIEPLKHLPNLRKLNLDEAQILAVGEFYDPDEENPVLMDPAEAEAFLREALPHLTQLSIT